MKIIGLSLFLVLSIIVNSQNQFIYKYITSDDEMFVDFLEIDNSDFYVLGVQRYYDSTRFIRRGFVLKMDINGNVIYHKTLTNYSEDISLAKIIRYNNNIYAFGSSKQSVGYGNIIIKYDDEFNELSRVEYFKGSTIDSKYIMSVVVSDSSFFIISYDKYKIPLLRNTFSILKTNLFLDSLKSFTALPYTGVAFNGLDDKNGGLRVFTFLYKLTGYGEVVRFDKNLNEISIDSLPDLLHYNNNSMWISDTSFLVSGTTEYVRDSIYMPGYYDWDMGIIVLDTNNNQLDYSCQIRRHGDENPGWNQNIVRSQSNNYYFVGTQDQAGISDTSKVILTKLDTAFNIIWEKTIWDDSSSFEASGIHLLNDGSIILLIKKYESQYSIICDAYIYKISKDGDVLFTSKIGQQKIKELNIYPNPANDFITIRTTEKAMSILNYKIYSIEGKVVKYGKCNSIDTRISIASFKQGEYFIKATTIEGFIYSGRFIVW